MRENLLTAAPITKLTVQQFVEEYDPTLEDSYRRQCVIDNVPSLLEILDTAGQEEYTALREQWIRDSQLFVIVYDVTRQSSFESAPEKLFRQVMETRGKLDATFSPGLVCLVGNKCDVNDKREVSTYDGKALARKLGCSFMETSAKTRTNVEEAFFAVVRADRRRQQVAEEKELKWQKENLGDQAKSSKGGFFKKWLRRK